MTRNAGRTVRYRQVTLDAVRGQSEDSAKMHKYFEREGYQADIAVLRHLHPGLQTFEQWLDGGGLQVLPAAA